MRSDSGRFRGQGHVLDCLEADHYLSQRMDFRNMLNPDLVDASTSPHPRSRMSLSSLLQNDTLPSPSERIADSEEPDSPLIASPHNERAPLTRPHSFSHLLSDSPVGPPQDSFDNSNLFPAAARKADSPAPSIVPDSDASFIVPDSDAEDEPNLVKPKREWGDADGDTMMLARSPEAGLVEVDNFVDVMGRGGGDDPALDAEDESKPLKVRSFPPHSPGT